MRSLVVFYSRTGTTRHVAEAIGRGLGADLEELREAIDRRGPVGYLRSGFDARLNRWVPIDQLNRDPARYDLVVVGSPVWIASVSAPVRAFLAAHSRRLPRVAFFVTEGGRGERRAFWQMAEIAGSQPVGTLALTQRDVERGQVAPQIDSFVGSLRQKAVTAVAPAARAS
jgi:flavodoxin